MDTNDFDFENRIMNTSYTAEDADVDYSLRPKRLEEYVTVKCEGELRQLPIASIRWLEMDGQVIKCLDKIDGRQYLRKGDRVEIAIDPADLMIY